LLLLLLLLLLWYAEVLNEQHASRLPLPSMFDWCRTS
jgi:hypothetical protein